jgi:phospholipid/cholesterol/gamma-HCH transport system ATP-binding protein
MTPKTQDSKNQPPVTVKGLAKSFGEQKVLNGIDLAVAQGETVAVVGRSGTGKSVLLKLLIGLHKPDAGNIWIYGQEIAKLGTKELNEVRKRVGFLFQQAALYDSLTVEENVSFPLRRHAQMESAERKDRARELLASVGMESDLEKLPSQISGGMQKRAGLARALALNPDLLLLDEPTAGLDPITAGEISDLVLDLQKKRKVTSIVVTHDLHNAAVFADRLVLLREGSIVMEGTQQELKKSRDPFVKRFLDAAAA